MEFSNPLMHNGRWTHDENWPQSDAAEKDAVQIKHTHTGKHSMTYSEPDTGNFELSRAAKKAIT